MSHWLDQYRQTGSAEFFCRTCNFKMPGQQAVEQHHRNLHADKQTKYINFCKCCGGQINSVQGWWAHVAICPRAPEMQRLMFNDRKAWRCGDDRCPYLGSLSGMLSHLTGKHGLCWDTIRSDPAKVGEYLTGEGYAFKTADCGGTADERRRASCATTTGSCWAEPPAKCGVSPLIRATGQATEATVARVHVSCAPPAPAAEQVAIQAPFQPECSKWTWEQAEELMCDRTWEQAEELMFSAVQRLIRSNRPSPR